MCPFSHSLTTEKINGAQFSPFEWYCYILPFTISVLFYYTEIDGLSYFKGEKNGF
jgi:hypothetical protein